MITVLVRVIKASRMIVIFTASQDDRFHSTPAERHRKKKQTNSQLHQLSGAVRFNPRETQRQLGGFLIAAARLLGHRRYGHMPRRDSRQGKMRKGSHFYKKRQKLEASNTRGKFHPGSKAPRGRLLLEIGEEQAGKESIWHERSLFENDATIPANSNVLMVAAGSRAPSVGCL